MGSELDRVTVGIFTNVASSHDYVQLSITSAYEKEKAQMALAKDPEPGRNHVKRSV